MNKEETTDYKQEYTLLVAAIVSIVSSMKTSKDLCNDPTLKLKLSMYIRQLNKLIT
jgi:hypothetical protein